MDFVLTADFWQAVIRISGPLVFAALAAVICSRAGILYIAIEGVMLISAFFSIAGTIWTGSVWLGIGCAVIAGIGASLLFGIMTMSLRMGDVVGGLVLHVGALGLTAFLSRYWFPTGATVGSARLGALWKPFGGRTLQLFFHQEPLIYVGVIAAIVVELFLHSRWGLIVRTSGESIRVARAFAIRLVNLRFAVLAAAGVFAGLSGAMLALVTVGTFNTDLVNGRGFIALACVMLAGWRPLGVAAAALFFGAADAFQFRVSGRVSGVGDWVRILPYVLTLVAMAAVWGRTQGPAEEGRGLPED
jgi:ABC-type uncharacterized transport system permease subunit